MPTPLHLAAVSLHRFKAAYELTDVPLGAFNVLIGRNGAGKSTLLEALQWIDTSVRQTVNVACDRYNGIRDLINHRYSVEPPGFKLETRLEAPNGAAFADYRCSIKQQDDEAVVAEEKLRIGTPEKRIGELLLKTENGARIAGRSRFVAADRLALSRLDELLPQTKFSISGADLTTFWQNAVFLRLEPTDLARSAPLKRPSLAPLLDEVGATLPALIEELDSEGREELLEMLQSVLPAFRGIEVVRSGDARAGNYALKEEIISRGPTGKRDFAIPSWMLSEGTRRMTAIFALLAHPTGPSLLCIEEVENGLDPVAVRKVLNHLKEASRRGVQVIVTTHSPWLLDDIDLADIQIVRRALGDTTYTRLQDDPTSQLSDPRVRPGGRYVHLLED